MQQGIRKLQWFEYLKVVFLEILNPLLCRVFANQVTYGSLSRHGISCACAFRLDFITFDINLIIIEQNVLTLYSCANDMQVCYIYSLTTRA